MHCYYDQWLSSGLSRALFCQQHQLSYSVFGYWVKKFRKNNGLNMPPLPGAGFTTLSFSPDSSLSPPPLMVLTFPSGVLLELFSAVESAFLKSRMLALSHTSRYYLYRSPTDMRLGIYALSGLVRNQLGFAPTNGDVFVFLSKRANQIRFLQWDKDGFALYMKKLEQGTFEWPKGQDTSISSHQLTLLLQGVVLDSVRLRKRYTLLQRTG